MSEKNNTANDFFEKKFKEMQDKKIQDEKAKKNNHNLTRQKTLWDVLFKKPHIVTTVPAKTQKAKGTTGTVSQDKAPVCSDAVFDHILNVVFKFSDKHPGALFSLQIYPSKENPDYVAFSFFCQIEGRLSYYQSAEAAEFLEYFNVVEDDGHFISLEYVRNTWENACGTSYTDFVLKRCVREYMYSHPSRKFDLSKTGATIHF